MELQQPNPFNSQKPMIYNDNHLQNNPINFPPSENSGNVIAGGIEQHFGHPYPEHPVAPQYYEPGPPPPPPPPDQPQTVVVIQQNTNNDDNDASLTMCEVCMRKTPSVENKRWGFGNVAHCLCYFWFIGPLSLIFCCMNDVKDTQVRCKDCAQLKETRSGCDCDC